jgi:hypothetical protein
MSGAFERKFSDRHGPFAYFCVGVIGVLCLVHPVAAIAGVGAIGVIYGARAGDRALRGYAEAKANGAKA